MSHDKKMSIVRWTVIAAALIATGCGLTKAYIQSTFSDAAMKQSAAVHYILRLDAAAAQYFTAKLTAAKTQGDVDALQAQYNTYRAKRKAAVDSMLTLGKALDDAKKSLNFETLRAVANATTDMMKAMEAIGFGADSTQTQPTAAQPDMTPLGDSI